MNSSVLRSKRARHQSSVLDEFSNLIDWNTIAGVLDPLYPATKGEPAWPRGYDAGKKINGRKRHALVDTDGRALLVEPHPANIQDRDGGGSLLQASRLPFPFIKRVWADGGYNQAIGEGFMSFKTDT